jgi:hypothetical protein
MSICLDRRAMERIRGEFLEMPGMKLRVEQVQRLCGVDASMCKLVMDELVRAQFLCVRSDGTYSRLTDGHALPTGQATAAT